MPAVVEAAFTPAKPTNTSPAPTRALCFLPSTTAWPRRLGPWLRDLWRADAPSPSIEPLGEREIAMLAHGGDVSIRAVETGAIRASHQIAGGHELERVGPSYLVIQGEELLVLDARDGAALRRAPIAFHGSIVAAGTTIATVTGQHRTRSRPTVTALDVTAGAIWRSTRTVAGESELAIAGDVIAACTDAGVVLGLDLGTGVSLWRVSIGHRSPGGVGPCRFFGGTRRCSCRARAPRSTRSTPTLGAGRSRASR